MMTWTDPADDDTIAASGQVGTLDLRKSGSAINSEGAWSAATIVSGMPTPGVVGTYHEKTVTGLSCCTTYHFALRATDDHYQLSQLQASDVNVKTLCFSCGGGSSFDAQVQKEHARADVASAASLGSQLPAGTLIAETGRTDGTGWRIRLHLEGSSDASQGPSAIQVETQSTSGDWHTRGQFSPGQADQVLGLGALRDAGRISIASSYGLDQVAPAISSRGQVYVLASAMHSRLGEMTQSLSTASASPALEPGDTLTLVYTPATSDPPDVENWYALARHVTTGTSSSRAPGGAGAQVPVQFALHQNQPNPFNATTRIRFDLPVAVHVRLDVFDLTGRRIRTLANGQGNAGYHSVEWNQRDDSGQRVSPGVYIYRLIAGEFREQRKMTLTP